METNKEIYDSLCTAMKESVAKYGYEEAQKRYVRSKFRHCIIMLLIACLVVVACFFIEGPDYTYSSYALMCLIFFIPAVLLKRYDLEFDELVEDESEKDEE